jgi:hypothetical protein
MGRDSHGVGVGVACVGRVHTGAHVSPNCLLRGPGSNDTLNS